MRPTLSVTPPGQRLRPWFAIGNAHLDVARTAPREPSAGEICRHEIGQSLSRPPPAGWMPLPSGRRRSAPPRSRSLPATSGAGPPRQAGVPPEAAAAFRAPLVRRLGILLAAFGRPPRAGWRTRGGSYLRQTAISGSRARSTVEATGARHLARMRPIQSLRRLGRDDAELRLLAAAVLEAALELQHGRVLACKAKAPRRTGAGLALDEPWPCIKETRSARKRSNNGPLRRA